MGIQLQLILTTYFVNSGWKLVQLHNPITDQTFNEMKQELWTAQSGNAIKIRNWYKRSNAGWDNVVVKREIDEKKSTNVSEDVNFETPQNASASPYARRKLPLDVTDIREVLEQDYAYVDKTGFALALIKEGRSRLITRPMGFGKTLFLSTLEQIFEGNRQLFRNTEIYRSDYDWTKHTVYRVDLSQIEHSEPATFEKGLKEHLARWFESFGVAANSSENLCEILSLFENVTLATGLDVVVLVDEYDAPIHNLVQYPRRLRYLNTAEENRQVIAFFLKFITRTQYNPGVKLAFVAGVHRYGWPGGTPLHVHPMDMDIEYATILGFTEEEVRSCFRNHIRDIARRRSRKVNVTEDEIVEEMREWYGGYRFTPKEVRVFNPASTLRYLSTRKAENYWYVARNRSVLIDEAARDNMPLGLKETTVGLRLKPDDFNISYLQWVDVRALMYRTGYVTIRKCSPEGKWYDLDYPNRETRDSYNFTYLRRDRRKDHMKDMGQDRGLGTLEGWATWK